ncbi:cytochrome P450 [Colletotrichum higginsianum IMI 349063]|uniref:Cytochrome P450 n=2 Tax=Colletotrichum higginsianum TaxID=80884 RepID=A0A1B7YN20_COLHI|nr:cytochrome P450 [Colletotrichum higginsianum IMI 349063]OBR13447.1 cytochrome P450 [Colletotrichum higginsianum IMI 349063]TID01577.1 Cytochrome P450 monooxygenase patH [Colletotrichum higginsianum]GJC95879.1 cytochrome P450 [Colletotrichum higginsianum]
MSPLGRSIVDPYLAAGVAILVALVLAALRRPKHPRLPPGTTLPPGPEPRPLIGNLLSIPPAHSWLAFHELIKQHGPVVRLSLPGGQEHVLLGTETAANDLLRRRGNLYSDRHHAPAASHLLTDDHMLLLLPYDDKWRRYRRFLHQVTMAPVAPRYETEQRIEAVRLLRDLLRDPADYESLFERFSVGLGLRIIYGLRLESARDRDARMILDIVHELERVGSPGAYAVDLFPCLLRLPERLAPWKRYLRGRRRRDEAFFRELVDRSGSPSWARTWLGTRDEWDLTRREADWMLGSVFQAAATTSGSALASFVLCMVRNPGWFGKLQREVDAVVGAGRLPALEDMPRLPLVRACVKETLRYYPITAGGFPHRLTEDDTYGAYFLSKGTVVHAVQWAIQRDPELYPDPELFNPDRWLDPRYPTFREPLSVYPNLQQFSAFGHGRRICQGINIAERSLNLKVALLAWGCDISRAKDGRGRDVVPPLYDFVEGFNVQPKRFQFDLQPRSRERVDLIERAYEQTLKEDPLL